MTKTTVTMMLAAASVWGQEAQTQPTRIVGDDHRSTVRMYQVKPANAGMIKEALCNVKICDTAVKGDVLVVRMPADLVVAVDALVPKLDSAPVDTQNIELTFYILQVAREPLAEASPIPAELQSTVDQIRKVLGLNAKLLDTGLVRTREHDRFSMRGWRPDLKINYELGGRTIVTGTAQAPSILIDDLEMGGSAPGWAGRVLQASVDLKPGQKAVIGKTALGPEANLVLVVSARVVE